MTVADLIAILQTLPGDARIVVDSYEGGVKDPSEAVRLIPLKLNEWPAGSFCGPHAINLPDEDHDELAVIIR